MLLAIDLQVDSVILKAIIVPTFSELAMLAAIVGIKIVLSWTLSKEVIDIMIKVNGVRTVGE